MIRRAKSPPSVRRRSHSKRSPVVLILLILVWCVVLGVGFAQAQSSPLQGVTPAPIGTVDVVPERLQLSQEVYLESCASCHIAIPPAVFPLETWRQVIQDPEHYGVQIRPPLGPSRLLVWDYLRTFSRPLLEEEEVPYRVNESRYFKALHPRVKLPRPTKLSGCVTCHPGANQFNFRSLTPEWENAP